jgi:hypothetical protein
VVFKKSKTFLKYMEKKTPAEQLADIIEANPSCFFHIDNDSWQMTKGEGGFKEITNSDRIQWMTEWYDRSGNYGAGIAEALVILLNRRGFEIRAESV